MKKIAVLGCTGSIGTTTLNIVRNYPTEFQIVLLANGTDEEKLKELQKEFRVASVFCAATAFDREYLSRKEAYCDADVVINGIGGIAGLGPSVAVIEAGKILATANKESLVCAGHFIERIKKEKNGVIYPLDSEHSTVWQCLRGIERSEIKSIVLTASGGAFRDYTQEQLYSATPEQALCHPNWKMGKKVTVDCATLLNKGMEIIEAKRLFGCSDVSAVTHRESVVHALIQTVDHAVIAGLAVPDMTLPIQYALFYPRRRPSTVRPLRLEEIGTLRFEKINEAIFPCFGLCKEAEKGGDRGGTVLNAANEVAVDAFLRHRCGFYDIADGIYRALKKFDSGNVSSLDDIFRIDREVREYTDSYCKTLL